MSCSGEGCRKLVAAQLDRSPSPGLELRIRQVCHSCSLTVVGLGDEEGEEKVVPLAYWRS